MIDSLPFHPTIPGMQALGFTKRGKVIWPIKGGSQPLADPAAPPADPSADPPADPPQDPPQDPNPTDPPDKGFPPNTAVKDMTEAQQAAYWRHYDRQKSDRLKAYDGITPEEAKRLRDAENQRRREGLEPNERALEDARTEARTQGAQEAASQWAPDLAEEIAARFIPDDQHRAAVMAGIDPLKFVKDGKFDKDALIGHLTGLQAAFGGAGSGGRQPSQWGQHSDRTPPATKASDEGLAEARRRGYIKD